MRPVWLAEHFFRSETVPCTTSLPPLSPPSGPRSITQSALRIISGLCSTTITVFPLEIIFSNRMRRFLISLKCNPAVGSSKRYSIFPPEFCCSCAASLTAVLLLRKEWASFAQEWDNRGRFHLKAAESHWVFYYHQKDSRFTDTHIQYLRNIFLFIMNLKSIFIEFPAFA